MGRSVGRCWLVGRCAASRRCWCGCRQTDYEQPLPELALELVLVHTGILILLPLLLVLLLLRVFARQTSSECGRDRDLRVGA